MTMGKRNVSKMVVLVVVASLLVCLIGCASTPRASSRPPSAAAETSPALPAEAAEVSRPPHETPYSETIHDIAKKGDLPELKSLLLANTNLVNARRESDNATVLHIAVLNAHLETVKYLIAIGAEVDAKATNGQTPLHLAASYVGAFFPGRQMAEVLIGAGAKIDAKAEGDGNQQPLHYAAHYNSADVAALLVQKGADVNATAANNVRPLHLASLGLNQFADGRWVGDLLIAENADANATAWTNQATPLWLASGMQNQNAMIVEKLLKAGADPKKVVDGSSTVTDLL